MIAPAQGWIPYEDRTTEQKSDTNAFHERIGSFGQLNPMENDTRTRVIFQQVQKSKLGSVLPQVWQVTGSCVGAGGANAYVATMFNDKYIRGDNEEVKPVCPWPTYGKGRQLGGMRRTGDGSFGTAQARACHPDYFGYLPWDYPGLPAPNSKRGMWWKWSRSVEYQWSHPSAWPINERELAAESKKYGIHTVTRCRNEDECESAIRQGFALTLASNFGTRARVEKGVLLGRWTTNWAHQMSGQAIWVHPDFGLLFWIQNQWGDAHGKDPTMSEFGVNGGFWMLSSDMARVCRTGEVYAHSNTGGFPSRKFEWTKIFDYEDE